MKESASSPDNLKTGKVEVDNPWLGPEAFREEDKNIFFGRDQVRDTLAQIVSLNRLVVLHGRSGLGKTSLLRAGLFPRLRHSGALPVYIRLTFGTAGQTALDLRTQVKTAIEGAAAAETVNVETPKLDPHFTLWEWFYTSEAGFFNERSRRVRPVLVFDQFEEVFTHGLSKASSKEGVRQFIEELTDLIRGSIPSTVAEHLEKNPAGALRFRTRRDPCGVLLALRQEFLPQLLQLRRSLPTLLDHRFELTGMTLHDARLVVTGPGGHLVDPGVPDQIVTFVAAAKRNADDPTDDKTVDPAILSIFCRELNNKRRSRRPPLPRITESLVAEAGEGIIADFCVSALDGLSFDVHKFIEEELVTGSGYRNSAPLGDIKLHGVTDRDIEILVERRFLSIEGSGAQARIELTHDVLIEPMVQSRNERRIREQDAQARFAEEEKLRAAREAEERERKEIELQKALTLARWERDNAELQREVARQKGLALRRQRTLALALAIIAIVLGGVVWQRSLASKKDQIDLNTTHLLTQSDAIRRSVLSSLELSLLLALQAFKTIESPEAGLKVTDLARLFPIPEKLGYSGRTRSIVLSPDENYAATRLDNEVFVWRMPGGEPAGHFQHNAMTSLAFSPDSQVIATAGMVAEADKAATFQVKLWDREGKSLGRLDLTSRVNQIAYSRDGQRMATACADGRIVVWDISNLQSPRLIASGIHELSAGLVAFSPKGDQLASADDQFVHIWGISKGSQLRDFGRLMKSATTSALSFLDDSSVVAERFNWPASNAVLVTLRGPTLSLSSIPTIPTPAPTWPSPKSSRLPATTQLPADSDAIARLFPADATSSSTIATFMDGLSTGPDQPSLVLLSRAGLLALRKSEAQLWHIADDPILGARPSPPERSGQMSLPSNTRLVAAAVASKRRYIVTAYCEDSPLPQLKEQTSVPDCQKGGADVWQFPADKAPLFSVVSGDGRHAAGIVDNSVISTDAPFAPPYKKMQWPSEDSSGPNSITLNFDGSVLGSVNSQRYAIWKPNDPTPRPASVELLPPADSRGELPKDPKGNLKAIKDLVVLPPTIARDLILIPRSSSGASWLELHDISSGALRWRQPPVPETENKREKEGKGKEKILVPGSIRGATLSPDGSRVVAWTGNKLYVWDTAQPDKGEAFNVAMSQGHIAFDTKGARMAVCAGTGVALIDLPSSNVRLLSTSSACRFATFDRTGGRIAIGAEDGSVLFRDPDSETFATDDKAGFQINAPVTRLAFSIDGRYLAVASDDGMIRVRDLLKGEERFRFFAGADESQASLSFAHDDRLVFANGKLFEWQPARIMDVVCRDIKKNLIFKRSVTKEEKDAYNSSCPDALR